MSVKHICQSNYHISQMIVSKTGVSKMIVSGKWSLVKWLLVKWLSVKWAGLIKDLETESVIIKLKENNNY